MHVACRALGAGSVAIVFPSEPERLSEDCAPLAQYAQRRSLSPKCPFGNLLIPESVESSKQCLSQANVSKSKF